MTALAEPPIVVNDDHFGSIETAGVDRAVQELEGKMKPESFDEKEE